MEIWEGEDVIGGRVLCAHIQVGRKNLILRANPSYGVSGGLVPIY